MATQEQSQLNNNNQGGHSGGSSRNERRAKKLKLKQKQQRRHESGGDDSNVIPTTKKPPKETRPKLRPLSKSPERRSSKGIRDKGVGIGDNVTSRAAIANAKQDSTSKMTTEEKRLELARVTPPPPRSALLSVFSSEDDDNRDAEDHRHYSVEKDGNVENAKAKGENNKDVVADESGGTNKQPRLMVQNSSATIPSAINLEDFRLAGDNFRRLDEDAEGDVISGAVPGNAFVQRGGNRFSLQEKLGPPVRITGDASNMERENAKCVVDASNVNSANEGDGNGNRNKTKEEPESNLLLLPNRSSSESDLSSSGSSSSSSSGSASSIGDDDSEVPDIRDNQHQLQRLQDEIRSRQKQLAKLLRGREGTAYARMMRSQEEAVSSHLLGRAQQCRQDPPSALVSMAANASLFGTGRNKASSDPSSRTKIKVESSTADSTAFKRLLRTIHSILLDEYYHTLPGAFSLVVHCVLYITVYATISKTMVWLCDLAIIYLTEWHGFDWFDDTAHESAFYLCLLALALAASKATGVLYDWNENRHYTKRVEFHFRNKWHFRCWDARSVDFFLGGELCDGYGSGGGGGRGEGITSRRARKKWGPRLKYLLDLVSFFVCYKCVDHFIYKIMDPMCDITESLIEGLPSRSLREQPGRHSYACSKVVAALDNPYALDMLSWISKMPAESEEANHWIANAKACGWDGEYHESSGDRDVDTCHAKDKNDADNGSAGNSGDDSCGPSPFLRWYRFLSVDDEEHIRKLISKEEYYDLVGEPNPKFSDPVRETVFLLISMMVCFGLLSFFRIPFLLI